jgi:hypothetical protein
MSDHDVLIEMHTMLKTMVDKVEKAETTGYTRCAVQNEKQTQLEGKVKWIFGLITSIFGYLAYEWAKGKS